MALKKFLFPAVLAVFSVLYSQSMKAQVFIDWEKPQTDDTTDDTEDIPETLAISTEDIVMPDYIYRMPLVFTHMERIDSVSPLKRKFSDHPSLQWVDKEIYKINNIKKLRHNVFAFYPEVVRYNVATLPLPPEQLYDVATPDEAVIIIKDAPAELKPESHEMQAEQVRYNWIKSFNGAAQFSQAYNSPNWYQGGNSHLNLLLNTAYNVKLNQTFYPNLLFETTVQYKLSVNSTPDDSLRNYNISEDLFQVNSKFGIRAIKKWFYTLTLQAKTQLLNNFETNTNTKTASFLSPGELNLGLGMTYSYENPNKTLTFSTSLSPASWNLVSCISKKMDPTDFEIPVGKKFTNQIGSTAEATLTWKLAYNINLTSRIFMFTDYSYLQGDWENTINFNINKFLTTTFYLHLRYDSSTSRDPDTKWHRWQLREVLSFGFSYTFATV